MVDDYNEADKFFVFIEHIHDHHGPLGYCGNRTTGVDTYTADLRVADSTSICRGVDGES